MSMVCVDHIKYLKNMLEPDVGYPHRELYECSDNYILGISGFKWKNRYSSLKQSTMFFKNLAFIDDLINFASSIDEFLIDADLCNIPREAINFAVCYCYMCPMRWFSCDWRIVDVLIYANNKIELKSWNMYNNLYIDISSKCLPMLDVEQFMSIQLDKSSIEV